MSGLPYDEKFAQMREQKEITRLQEENAKLVEALDHATTWLEFIEAKGWPGKLALRKQISLCKAVLKENEQ